MAEIEKIEREEVAHDCPFCRETSGAEERERMDKSVLVHSSVDGERVRGKKDMNTIILILLFLAIAFCLHGIYRNEQIYRFRIRLIDEVFDFSKQDTDATFELLRQDYEQARELLARMDARYEARMKWLHSVSCQEMAAKFWKPLDSFYAPIDLTNPLSEEEWPEVIEERI